MHTETLSGRSLIKNLVLMCHYFLSMGGNLTKIGLCVYLKYLNLNVTDFTADDISRATSCFFYTHHWKE